MSRPPDERSVRVQPSWRDGVRVSAPMLPGTLSFATLYGVTAGSAGLAPVETISMSLLVFAGAAQVVIVEQLGRNVPLAIIVVTALVINVRMAIYGLHLAPFMQSVPSRIRAVYAYMLTDEGYAFTLPFLRGGAGSRGEVAYSAATMVMVWVAWQTGTISGVLLGAMIPDGLSLDFAIPLSLLAILVRTIGTRSQAIVAGVSAIAAVALFRLPLNVGFLIALAVGVVVGQALDRRPQRARA